MALGVDVRSPCVMDWWSIQGVSHLLLYESWDKLQQRLSVNYKSGEENGWMKYIWLKTYWDIAFNWFEAVIDVYFLLFARHISKEMNVSCICLTTAGCFSSFNQRTSQKERISISCVWASSMSTVLTSLWSHLKSIVLTLTEYNMRPVLYISVPIRAKEDWG